MVGKIGILANATSIVVVVGLIIVVDIAVVEIHVPGIVGVVMVGSTRPIIVRLSLFISNFCFILAEARVEMNSMPSLFAESLQRLWGKLFPTI